MFVLSADEVYGDAHENHRNEKMGEINKLERSFIDIFPKNKFNYSKPYQRDYHGA